MQEYGPGLVAMRKIEAAQYMVENLGNNPSISFVNSNNTMNMLQLNK